MTEQEETLPTDPRRVKAFASFFKNYMSLSSVVVAALPVPVTTLNALPTFADQKAPLATYTPLFCFLTLGYIFYIRHALARWMFPEQKIASTSEKISINRIIQIANTTLVNFAPLFLILGSAYLVYLYHYSLSQSVDEIAHHLAKPTSATNKSCLEMSSVEMVANCTFPEPEKILYSTYPHITNGSLLLATYIGMFVLAEAAFILMATREYLQDLLQISDAEVICGKSQRSSS